MAVDERSVDGVAPDARPYISGRKRIIILIAIIAVAGGLMVFSQYFRATAPRPQQTTRSGDPGLPWHRRRPRTRFRYLRRRGPSQVRRRIVGAMRDDAVVTWIMEACTGHPGGITTIHGSSAGEAVRRIGHLVKSSPRAAGFDIAQLLADTIDVIIPLYETDPAIVGKSRGIGAVWFAGDALRRTETAADLLRAT